MYDTLAKFYDKLMDDVDYDGWSDYLLNVIGERDDGVDLACGTGAITLRLISRGKKVYGLDSSEQMLSIAAANATRAGVGALFVRGDMSDFKPAHKLGFATAVCDGINYLSHPEKAFAAVYAALECGGVFVFDLSSEYKLRKRIGNNTFYYEDGDITYIWRNSLSARTVDMELTFFERRGETFIKSKEIQRQYIHSAQSLGEKLTAVGFKYKMYRAYTFEPHSARDERICFVAEKGL